MTTDFINKIYGKSDPFVFPVLTDKNITFIINSGKNYFSQPLHQVGGEGQGVQTSPHHFTFNSSSHSIIPAPAFFQCKISWNVA